VIPRFNSFNKGKDKSREKEKEPSKFTILNPTQEKMSFQSKKEKRGWQQYGKPIPCLSQRKGGSNLEVSLKQRKV